MKKKLPLLFAFCFNIYTLCAQDVIPPDNVKDLHLQENWKDKKSNDNKDLDGIIRASYSSNKLFIYPSAIMVDSYYIVDKHGKIELSSCISSYGSATIEVSLSKLPYGQHTLYLYEGDRFWYGSFAIER